MQNAKRGITLIALIITVIILLILVGTAISISISGGDLFGRSQNAVAQYNNRVAEKENKINEVWSILDNMGPKGPTLPEEWDSTKVASVKEGSITVDGETKTVKAPIPSGYTASTISPEDEIREGLVIYQGTEAVDANSATSRNQFVWIPVPDINSMVMCKSNAEGSICNIKLENGELVCKTHSNATGATNMCGRQYGVDSNTSSSSAPYIYSTSMDFNLRNQTFSDYREPDLVTVYDKDSNTSYMTAAGVSTATELKTQMQDDFYAMAKSVATYGGFYIGRYEAGYNSANTDTYISQKNKTVLDATTSSANKWYGLYSHLRTSMGSLNSQMIWGCQYDQAIKFIKENSSIDPEIGHTNIGLKSTPDVSGAEGVNDIQQNIYDLEGNRLEWTEQAYSTNYRVSRGSGYGRVSISYFRPASDRDRLYPNYTNADYSSRPGLYL